MQEMQETWVWFLGQKDPQEKETATHFSIFAWEIPWTEEPGGLLSIGCTELDATEVAEHAHTPNKSQVPCGILLDNWKLTEVPGTASILG